MDGLDETPLGDQEPHELSDEERIAAGAGVDRCRDLRRGRGIGDDLDQPGNVRLPKPLQEQGAGGGLARELSQSGRERVARAELDVPVRPDDQHTGVGGVAAKNEAGAAMDVRGMQVLDDEQQRPLSRRALQERRGRIEEPEPRTL